MRLHVIRPGVIRLDSTLGGGGLLRRFAICAVNEGEYDYQENCEFHSVMFLGKDKFLARVCNHSLTLLFNSINRAAFR